MSLRARLIGAVARRTIKPLFDSVSTADSVPALRTRLNGSGRLVQAPPAAVNIEPARVGGVVCEWLVHDGADASRVIVYLHGGAYCFLGLNSHRSIGWRLSQASGARVLMVDYALAPESPFPAALEDVMACYTALREEGYRPERMAFAGDSAGGGLALASLLNLKNQGLPLPACALLLSPWLDLTLSGDSLDLNADSEVVLTRRFLATCADFYLNGRAPQAPLASPLLGDLTHLPPLLVYASDREMLLSDAERLVNIVRKTGGDIMLDVWPDLPHAFPVFADTIPEARAAIASAGEFLANHLQ